MKWVGCEVAVVSDTSAGMCCKLMDADVGEKEESRREEERRGLSICCPSPGIAARQCAFGGNWQAQSSPGGSSKLVRRQQRALSMEAAADLDQKQKEGCANQPYARGWLAVLLAKATGRNHLLAILHSQVSLARLRRWCSATDTFIVTSGIILQKTASN